MISPALGDTVLFRTDGTGETVYDLPAIVTVTPESFDVVGSTPMPAPEAGCVHLTVFTPAGAGNWIDDGAEPRFEPGSGTKVALNIPYVEGPPQLGTCRPR